MRGFSHLTIMCLLAALSGSCGSGTPTTQVMLVLDADTKARMMGTDLLVEIQGLSADNQVDGLPVMSAFRPKEPGNTTWPLSLGISPRGGDARRTYHITATLSGNQGPIAVLRARSGFVAQKVIALGLFFSDDCLGAASLDCTDTRTCFQGTCVDDFIDASALPPYEPGNLDGFSAADGGTGSSRLPAIMSSDPIGDSAGRRQTGASGSSSKPGAGTPQAGSGAGGSGSIENPGNAPVTTAPGDCGDSQINPGEKCDTGIPEGMPGACPTQCKASDGCHPATLEGSGCQSECVVYPITQVESGDGCCPPGSDAKDDDDCGALCGNGVQEAGEKCDPPETCPTMESCANSEADRCLHAMLVGDAASCTAECVMQPITACESGDGCCGSGECNHNNDSDCSASCGDGVVDPANREICEPVHATLACPTTCTDSDACTSDVLVGSAKNCNAVCTHVPISVSIFEDGCCPSGANANSDFDCQAKCGNGIVERGERCDGRCPSKADCDDGNPCTRDDIEGNAGSCNVRCTHAAINVAANGDKCCPRGANANNDNDCLPVCGNGVREGNEVCDGDDCQRCTDNDNNPCTRVTRGGTNCNPTCMPETITKPANGDGCCPDKANSSNDSDCTNAPPAVCPNGKPETGEICDGNCPVSCDDGKPCTEDSSTGSAQTCDLVCKHSPITAPKNNDMCCPDGANSGNDNDCKPGCPNGAKDPGETCDGADCPTSCPTLPDPCTKNELTGSAATCDAKCVATPVTKKEADGCCVTGENHNTDPACDPRCGNGVVEMGEKCDTNCECKTSDMCKRAVPGGTDACNPTCTIGDVPTGPSDGCCPGGATPTTDKDCPGCGNGRIDSGEQCDDGPGDTATCVNCKTVTQTTDAGM